MSAPWEGDGTAASKPKQGPLTGSHQGAFKIGTTYRCEFERHHGSRFGPNTEIAVKRF
ncbi:hypothetical protein [Streptomyces sp. NPDC047043]|uniref:hypothetical protein n=1 Tax=Streptomyces sp. NPDC047043 TaxID=3154497 RepID=UPI0033EB9040